MQPLDDQPFIDGGKISLKPTPNFEMGMGITTVFAGAGVPMTLHKFSQSILPVGTVTSPGTQAIRAIGAVVSICLPVPEAAKLVDALRRCFHRRRNQSVAQVGQSRCDQRNLHAGEFPKIPKLDFRAEGIYTDPPGIRAGLPHGFFYWNDRFLSGYTNDGSLIGSWKLEDRAVARMPGRKLLVSLPKTICNYQFPA